MRTCGRKPAYSWWFASAATSTGPSPVSRSTLTRTPSASRAPRLTTVVPPAAAPACTPGSVVSGVVAPSHPMRTRWISVGSSEAVTSTPSSAAPSTVRTYQRGSPTGSPSTTTRRTSSTSSVQTTRPPGPRSGTPTTASTQTSSRSSCTSVVVPVAGSTVSTWAVAWSRAITSSTGSPYEDHAARSRYGNASWSQVTSVRVPSSPTSHSVASTLAVPAAGYRWATGFCSGCAGSVTYQTGTGDSS